MVITLQHALGRSLEHFSVSFGGRATGDGGHSIVQPKTIAKPLLVHTKGLQSIDIDMDEYMRGSYHRPRYYGRLEEGIPEDEDGNSEIFVNRRNNESEMKLHRKDPYFCIYEDEARAAGLPVMAKDLPDMRKYGTALGSLEDFTALESLSIGVKLLLRAPEYTPGAEHMEL